MTAQPSRRIGTDPAGHVGTCRALNTAFGAKSNPLLIDQAAEADFARMIDRLRGEPGSSKGGNQ